MKRSLLIVEGGDDVKALRVLLKRLMGFTPAGDVPRFEGAAVLRGPERLVEIHAAGDREQAARVAAEQIRDFLFDGGYDRVGLSFDPDTHTCGQANDWVQRRALKGLPAEEAGHGWTVRTDGRSVELIPIPWDAGPGFDDLPEDRRNLERVALGIVQAASNEEAALVLKLLQTVQEAGRALTWKMAYRLFNAVWKAESDAIDAVFGQSEPFRNSVRSVLESTNLWRRLAFCVGYEDPT